MKNCGECKEVRVNRVLNIQHAYCGLTSLVVPQYTETNKPIEYLGIPDHCPLNKTKKDHKNGTNNSNNTKRNL